MKTSEKLYAVLCDPDGWVVIHGSEEDKIILLDAIQEVIDLERIARHSHVNSGVKGDDSCKECGLDLRHNIHKRAGEE